jgi:hypothetical protein
MTDFIRFEAPFKYMKESPHKEYSKKISYANFKPRIPHSFHYQYSAELLDIIQSYSDKHQNKFNNKIIVSVGCGSAQMEMHSSNLHMSLNINKRALFCAKFAMKYLFRKKSNLILQHYNMKEGLAQLTTKIQIQIPSVNLIALFQHPSPSIDPVVRDVLIGGTMECMSMCIMDIVSSFHFVYIRHSNRNIWNINELESLIIQESSLSHLLALTFRDNIKIPSMTHF